MNAAEVRKRELIAHLSAKARARQRPDADERLSVVSLQTLRLLAGLGLLGFAAMFGYVISVGPLGYSVLAALACVCIVRVVKLNDSYRTAFIETEMAKGLSELDAIKLYYKRCSEAVD